MDEKNFNEKAINDVYKNAHIALQSISDLLPAVTDDDIRKELSDQYEGYEKIIGEISTYMAENNIKPKDINPFKKAIMWTSIKMKALVDSSRNQIAEMMINGTVMGINELKAMDNEKENLNEDTAKFVKKLLDLEESYEQRLKKFL